MARLHEHGYHVMIRSISAHSPAVGFDRILSLEARRFAHSLARRLEQTTAGDPGPPDLVIDLTGIAEHQDAELLSLDFSGFRSFETGMPAMLAVGSADIVARLDGVAIARARPMIRDRLWLSRFSDDVLAGAIALTIQCVTRFFADRITPLDPKPVRQQGVPSFAGAYFRFLTSGIRDRLAQKRKLKGRPFYWQVAYRMIDGPGIAESGKLDGPAFIALEDDGRRFYADPFPFEHEGRHYLFVEEFPYHASRGNISVAELGDDGRLGTPKPVLEEPFHLSYPQVFAEDGEIFMIPEGSAAKELVLYRAERFPDRWVRDTVLLSDIQFNDATLLRSDGRYWLVGTEQRGRGNASDTMVVYSADAVRGPWTAHALNPIAIDHSAARPGGAFIRSEGRVLLPVQDGSRVYGGGLGLMELLQVDDADVVFGPVRPVEPGPAWDRSGIHTLNRIGRLEVIDSAG
jgi:hypothetical protein